MNSKGPPIPGVMYTSLQLPKSLHERMKAVRQARRAVEMADVPLHRLYREAVEFYLNAAPQQELLELCWSHGRRKKTAPARVQPEANELLHADR